jgi:hypothetical protein
VHLTSAKQLQVDGLCVYCDESLSGAPHTAESHILQNHTLEVHLASNVSLDERFELVARMLQQTVVAQLRPQQMVALYRLGSSLLHSSAVSSASWFDSPLDTSFYTLHLASVSSRFLPSVLFASVTSCAVAPSRVRSCVDRWPTRVRHTSARVRARYRSQACAHTKRRVASQRTSMRGAQYVRDARVSSGGVQRVRRRRRAPPLQCALTHRSRRE